MKYIALCSITIPWLLACAGTQRPPVATQACSQAVLPVDGNQIWVNKEGAGRVTVVFESGFGNDSH